MTRRIRSWLTSWQGEEQQRFRHDPMELFCERAQTITRGCGSFTTAEESVNV